MKQHLDGIYPIEAPRYTMAVVHPPKVCTVNGCETISSSLGYCKTHYTRFKRHGDPLIVGRNPWKDGQGSAKDNTQWKGDNVSYKGLHAWVRMNLSSEGKCWDCGKEARLDVANISQEYKRDLSDWEYLCRSCHMIKDGRLARLREDNRKWRASIQPNCLDCEPGPGQPCLPGCPTNKLKEN